MDVAERLASVRTRIINAATRVGRSATEIRLIAVSKTVPVQEMQLAYEAGQLVFGENYVQEARKKRTEFTQLLGTANSPEFHLIGRLQRNKVREALECFEFIHTVDRIELAEVLSREALRRGKTQPVLIQVNVSGEASKSGVSGDGLERLVCDLLQLPGLACRGLMSIGSFVPETAPESARRQDFRKMEQLRRALEVKLGIRLPELSMGMSHDFELAIEEGATMVRVGSAVFGPRE